MLSLNDIRILQLYKPMAYHGVNHILELLELHATGRTRGIVIPDYKRPVLSTHQESDLISAIVAHDVVYVPGSDENEYQSYEVYASYNGHSIPVYELIMATKGHHWSSNPLENHLSDLDMSPLGADREQFDINSANIIHEFMSAGYTFEECIAGRLKFFEKTLKQDRIFHTPQFHNALEAKARALMTEDLNDN